MRPSWIEVDLDAVESNARAIRSVVDPADFCAVVKADAYGHGDVPVAEAALAGGAEWLAVALVSEAGRLREAGIEAPILLLSEPPDEDAAAVVGWGIVPTVYSLDFPTAVAAAAETVGATPYRVHLKIDTGMHRVGAPPAEAVELARMIDRDPRLSLAGLWTHFAVSEEDPQYTEQQLDALLEFRDLLQVDGIRVPVLHAANTAAALGFPAARLDMVRVGLGLYGLLPSPDLGAIVGLRPAMRVVSHVTYVRRLSAQARPSYGRSRRLGRDAFVATVPLGYADGVPRRLVAEGGEVLIRGRRYPFAGTITMDQVVIDVGDDSVEVGDEVVFIGRQGSNEVSADEWAERLDTINYEVVCQFGPRLPRRYVRGGPDAERYDHSRSRS
jgi:alanine racemase